MRTFFLLNEIITVIAIIANTFLYHTSHMSNMCLFLVKLFSPLVNFTNFKICRSTQLALYWWSTMCALYCFLYLSLFAMHNCFPEFLSLGNALFRCISDDTPEICALLFDFLRLLLSVGYAKKCLFSCLVCPLFIPDEILIAFI